MPKKLMSDAELRRRKKLQGSISRTTSTLGLTGLGITGAAAIAARKPGALKAVKKIPGMKKATPEKMKNVAINTGIVSGGIGGLGGYNFAAYTNAESRKRQAMVAKKPVKKNYQPPLEMGFYGEQGSPLTHQEIEAEIEKAWTPSASNFDSEAKREKRSNAYQTGALAGAGVGGAYAGHHGVQALRAGRGIKPKDMAEVKTKTKTVKVKGKKVRVDQVSHGKAAKSVPVKAFKPTAVHGAKAAAGLATVGLAAGAHAALKRKHSGSWQPYSKGLSMDEIEKGFGFKPGKAFSAFKGAKKVQPTKEFESPFSPGGPFEPGKALKPKAALPKHPANRAPKKTTAQLNVPAGHKPANYNRLRSYNEVNG